MATAVGIDGQSPSGDGSYSICHSPFWNLNVIGARSPARPAAVQIAGGGCYNEGSLPDA